MRCYQKCAVINFKCHYNTKTKPGNLYHYELNYKCRTYSGENATVILHTSMLAILVPSAYSGRYWAQATALVLLTLYSKS